MLIHIPSHAILVPSQKDSPSPSVPSSPDLPSFRPLPPLPLASTLELPSFSDQHSADPLPRISAPSLPASALFRVSASPVSSTRRVVVRKKVPQGPHWIPAFHHPNSPYVPWPSPVRRRILPPPSPLSPSPVCPSSPRIRSGAVAPEPWASSTFSQTHSKSAKEKISGSWKSFKNSIKLGVKSVLGKSLRTLCTSQDMLRTYDDNDAPAVDHPNASWPESIAQHRRSCCHSLASLVSSDSRTLETWLAERRADASSVADDVPGVMSVEEYERMGSWLNVRSCDCGWVCGMQDCGMHTASGSPYAASEHPDGLRMVMPFDSADLLSKKHSSPTAFPSGPFYTPQRFHSLPRLPTQSMDIYYAQEAKPATLDDAQRESARRRRECSMPASGNWPVG